MDVTTNAGPYKATRLWNDVVLAFRHRMPCGRHRQHMKTYDDCFPGAAAADWLHHYLKSSGSFSSDVSREKAVSLLNKLYRAGIFEDVRVSKSMRHKQEVQEHRLYKFSPISPSKMKISRLPLAPRNDAGINCHTLSSMNKSTLKENLKLDHMTQKVDNTDKKHKLARTISFLKKDKHSVDTAKEDNEEENYPKCHLVTRVLTTKEITDTWKAAFIARTKKILGLTDLTGVLKLDLVDGYNVMHNCIYLNKSGFVTNIDSKDQLPHWVMSAMKCLARWPEPPEPGLPSYPGFEKDVFGVVRDYFLGHDQPLIPSSLCRFMMSVFVMASSVPAQRSSPSSTCELSPLPSTLWSSTSLEDIILNLTRKYCLLDSVTSLHTSSQDPRFSNGWLGTQDDIQIGGQVSSTCFSKSNFPFVCPENLTEGSHLESGISPIKTVASALTSQVSCPSLSVDELKTNRCLSRTTQSAKENGPGSTLWLSSINRKYGSTPNLKVSKFETAFGPDNRTVTHVFYENGVTTAYSHEDGLDLVGSETRECSSSSQVQYLDLNMKVGKQEYMKLEEGPVARSQSCLNVSKNVDYSRLHVNANNSRSGCVKNINRSSSFSGIVDLVHKRKESKFSSVHKIEEDINENQNLHFVYPLEEEIEENINNLDIGYNNPILEVSPRLSSSLSNEAAIRRSTSLMGKPSQVIDGSQSSSVLTSQHFEFSKTSTPVFPRSELNIPASQPAEEAVLCGSYGPGYRPRSAEAAQRTSSFSQRSDQRIGLSTNCSPQRYVSVPSLNKLGQNNPVSCVDLQSPYNPVLDAAKRRLIQSSSNLTEAQPDVSDRLQSLYKTGSLYKTSTPYSPSLRNATSLHMPDHQPFYQVSAIAPPRGSNSQAGTHFVPQSFIKYPQTRLSEDRAKNSLQMATLLLPPSNRRKLHLLFKLMMKMTSNPNLCLDPTQSTRSLVLNTFYPAIIRSPQDMGEEDIVQLQFVSFMLDFYEDIFAPPADIKTHVSSRLKAMQQPKVVYSPNPTKTVRFCQQASVAEFEKQRLSSSQNALEKLLEDIAGDQKMDLKEKKKRLKQCKFD